jgi:hypothetical protein
MKSVDSLVGRVMIHYWLVVFSPGGWGWEKVKKESKSKSNNIGYLMKRHATKAVLYV